MGKYRVGRVSEAIKEEVSQILREELKDPRVGFVTVTGVEVSNDLSYARIYVSIMGDSEQVQESIQALNRAVGFIRSEVGKRVRLRHTPELVFKIDESLERGYKISNLLSKIVDTPEGQE